MKIRGFAVATLTLWGGFAQADPPDDDWKTAPAAELARSTRAECSGKQLVKGGTTWLRIVCTGKTGWITPRAVIAAGPSEDVDVEMTSNWLRLTFPMQRGDRRVMLVSDNIGVSAVWLSDAAKPTIVIN